MGKRENSSSDQAAFLAERLSASRLNPKLGADIVSQFWKANLFNSLLANDYFLNLVAEFVVEKRVRSFSRVDFYTYLNEKLVNNDDVSNKLQKLAFAMELMQQTRLSLSEAERILAVEEIRALEASRILSIDADGVAFPHQSIHSYFSALYLSQSVDPISFFESTIEKNEDSAVPATWYEVLAFLLQMPSAADLGAWLISKMMRSPAIVDEDLLNAISQANIEGRLTAQQKDSFFKFLFALYEKKRIWLPNGAEIILARIASHDGIDLLKRALLKEYKTDTERIVVRGNAVGVVDEILRYQPSLLQDPSGYWHDLLVSFANSREGNGVLQRRSLRALTHYKRPDDISRVTSVAEHPDRLVYEALLTFCYEIAPNSKETISYLANGLLRDSEIYARYGFYAISSAEGLHNFFTVLASKESYIHKFLDGESIFNSNDRHEDDKLLGQVRKYKSQRLLKAIKRFIVNAYKVDHGYYAERSYFLRELVAIAKERDVNYALELLGEIEKEEDIFRLSSLLVRAVTLDNYYPIYLKLTQRFDEARGKNFIYLLAHEGRDDIQEDALSRGLIEQKLTQSQSQDDYKTERELATYKDFKVALQPEEGKYIPSVFETFIRNKDAIEKHWTDTDKERLIFLAKEIVLDKMDPLEINLKINNRNEDGSNTNFTITSYAQYYGDVVRVALEFIDKDKLSTDYRRQFINFLPYAYDGDRQLIFSLVGVINEEELQTLHELYLDKKRDARYYMPEAYVSLVEESIKQGNSLQSSRVVLKSFIDDPKFRSFERESALTTLGKLLRKGDREIVPYLRRLFKSYKTDVKDSALSVIANQILIDVFEDRNAILWRFEQIKLRAVPFKEQSGFHEVGALEHEIHHKEFAGPLTKLGGVYIPNFISLLDFSIELLVQDESEYLNYATYIWAVAYDYFAQLARNKDIKPLKRLEAWYEQRSGAAEGANWFEGRLENLRKVYAAEMSKANALDEALERMERLAHGS